MQSYRNTTLFHKETLESALLDIPECLRQGSEWMGTRLKPKEDGKVDKPPYRVRRGEKIAPGSKTNPNHRASFEEALGAHKRSQVDAIGYVFTADDPFTVVDLDECRNAESGEISPWALEIVEAIPTYWEVSLSGTGLHGIVRAKKNTDRCRKGNVEIYDGATGARFIVLTGQHVDGTRTDVRECQEEIDNLTQRYLPPKTPVENIHRTATEPIDLKDSELLDKARNARNGDEFRALYDHGDISGYPSHSEARMALLRMLAFWTGWDEERTDRLYKGSALHAMPGYDKKWARLAQREIRLAIAKTPRAYRQEARASKENGGELAKIIEALKAQAANMAWEGRSGPTDNHVYSALLDIATRYGSIAKKGVIVSADVRTLALEAGVGRGTVGRALGRLDKERHLLRLSKKSTRKNAAVYLLKYPTGERTAQGGTKNQCVDMCPTLSQIRNPGPTSRTVRSKTGKELSRYTESRFLLRRLGKLAMLVLEKAIMHGEQGVTLRELAAEVGRKPQNLRRIKDAKALTDAPKGPVDKLLEARLLVVGPDGKLRVPGDIERRLEVELEQSGCVDARERDAKRYARERSAFRARHKNPPDDGPAREELEQEHLRRVEGALAAFGYQNSGPQLILFSYLDGETKEFDYVIKAVAYYYGVVAEGGIIGDGWRLWKRAVEDAYALYVGEVREEGREEPRCPTSG